MNWFSGIIYDAIPEGQTEGVKAGSTENLARRQRGYRNSEKSWFGKGVLRPVRTIEGFYFDRDSFIAHLRIAEFFYILNKGYYDTGRNSENPILSIHRNEDSARESIRISSRKQGLKNARSGHCARIAKIAGQRNIESGHIAALGRLRAKSGDLVRLAREPENRSRLSELGKKQGKINTDSGHLNKIRTAESTSKGGKTTAERGANFLQNLTFEQRSNRSRELMHDRWHIKRDKPNLDCSFCVGEQA